MTFETITDEQILNLKSSLITGKYNLLLGSGVSTDSWNDDGELLSGEELRLTLCNLQRVPKNTSLQKVYDLLNEIEVRKYITSRYSNCTPGASVKHFPKFLWRRVFTFNIDDALESAFEENGSLQTLKPINFGETFADSTKIEELFAIHLHGFVRQESKGYVFSRNDYINQMTSINPWMNMLAQLIKVEPFIMIGTSLDEVDLDYYMSLRNESSGRVDEGPSVFVTPNPTKVSRNECEKHNLLLFKGTCNDFMKYCNELAPNRPTPLELVGREELQFFSGEATKRQILSFWSDFELVPGSAPKNKGIPRFVYGALPNWEDLSANFDISRNCSSRIISEAEKLLADPAQHPRLAIIFEKPGMGKSTILRRCAFELANRGSKVIKCSAFSQLDPNLVAELIDLVTSPLILVADDFADQVTVISDIIRNIKKKDVVILAAERSYRKGYVNEVLSGIDYISFGQLKMNSLESDHLIDAYISLGLVGAKKALHQKASFSEELRIDPIAVACRRILNDFKPIARIIGSILEDCDEFEKQVYLMCSLAQYCFSGGVRYPILASVFNSNDLHLQVRREHPLPLNYSTDKLTSFVVPENRSIAEQILDRVSNDSPEEMLDAFVALGNSIASWVNRKTIRSRSPEARLAARLFDFDSVVNKFLGDLSENFYDRTHESWKWNSRYWEQVSLYWLNKYYENRNTNIDNIFLENAVQHARNAVSIEHHPLTLTTLSRVLLAKMSSLPTASAEIFDEAFANLLDAIDRERKRERIAIHPYMTLLRGASEYLRKGGSLSRVQSENLNYVIENAQQNFSKDADIVNSINLISKYL